MAIDNAAIVAQYGDYYLNSGQNMDRLRSAIRQPSVTPSYAKPLIVDSEVFQMANTQLDEVVQQFQHKWTPKGTISWEPNEIRLRRMKMDIELYPDKVVSSWLGFLANINENERAAWPLVRYMLENEVIPQKAHDMETKAYFKGVYAPPTDGVAGSASNSMDGIKKLVDDGLAAGTMNAVSLSAVPDASNRFDIVEEFADGLDEVLDDTMMAIMMSKTAVKQYLRDKRNTHGTDVNYDADKITVDFKDNVQIVGLPSMAGSNYMIATPLDNLLYLRRVNGMKPVRVEESKRQVFMMTDWYEALGFGYDQLVFAYKPV